MEGSFQRLTVSAATPTPAPLYPGWVLLQEDAHYDERENATTAGAMTSSGHTVKVTFFPADPPAISYFRFHGPELKQADFRLVVVFSEKDLVLLRLQFIHRPRTSTTVRESETHPDQFFVYKAAASHGKPSLTPIPTTRPPVHSILSYPSILPFQDDEHGNFLVADLDTTRTPGHYFLHTFSSRTNQWTARPLQLQAPPAVSDDLPHIPDKAITLGAGAIGWVDLWRGIVVCHVFDPDPVLRFIPLPKAEFDLRRRDAPRPIRDVTCCSNGFIRFIEIERYPRPDGHVERSFKTTRDLDTAVVLHDSELFFQCNEDLLKKPVPRDWKIRTCYRHTSWNLWCRWHPTLHVDDILVNDPGFYTTLPQLWDFGAAKFTLRNLIAEFPGLSVYAGDVVYLLMKVEAFDTEAWVVGVDLRKKTVEALEPYSAGRSTPLACSFSRYLNATPSSCAPEDGYGQNCPLNRYPVTGNITQNDLKNMQIAGEHGNDGQQLPIPVNSYLFHPQLVIPPHSFPQTLQYKFTPTGPGYVGQVPLLTPIDNRFRPQMPGESAPPAVPFNTPMPRVPMDDRFRPQMPPVPASLAVHFNTLMPRLPMDDRFLSQMPPVPVFPVVPFNTLPLVPMDDGLLSQMSPLPAYSSCSS